MLILRQDEEAMLVESTMGITTPWRHLSSVHVHWPIAKLACEAQEAEDELRVGVMVDITGCSGA